LGMGIGMGMGMGLGLGTIMAAIAALGDVCSFCLLSSVPTLISLTPCVSRHLSFALKVSACCLVFLRR